jgi:hypothetical protein
MFKHTCLVNACRTVGTGGISLSKENDGGSDMDVRVLHNVGELSVLRYACVLMSWSSNMDVISSRDPSFSSKDASDSCLHILRSSHFPASSPQSSSYFLSSCVSCKNNTPTVRPNTTTNAQTMLGRRNGNVSNRVPANTPGSALAGCARTPPSVPPIMVL